MATLHPIYSSLWTQSKLRPNCSNTLNNYSCAEFALGNTAHATQLAIESIKNIPLKFDENIKINKIFSLLASVKSDTLNEFLDTITIITLFHTKTNDWKDILIGTRNPSFPLTATFGHLVDICISLWTSNNNREIYSFLNEAKHLAFEIGNDNSKSFQGNLRFLELISVLQDFHQRKNYSEEDMARKNFIVAIGDSHSLSYSGETIQIEAVSYSVRSELIKGAKAWHLAKDGGNPYKWRFEWLLNTMNPGDHVLCSFGEIDCRLDEGILDSHKKTGRSFIEITKNLVTDFVKYVRKTTSEVNVTPIFVSIPAPYLTSPHYVLKNSTKEDRSKLIDIINIFNTKLKEISMSQELLFIDIYRLTNNGSGISNGSFHIDPTHLIPGALSRAVELSTPRLTAVNA